MLSTSTITIPAAQMQEVFKSVLLRYGFTIEKAGVCAEVFTGNSIDGIYTHGVNRFAKFVDYVKKRYINVDAEPALESRFGSLEQWHGHYGPGPLNALRATDRAMELAAENGIGCVAMGNTNHWMRGGTYGWRAAAKGFVLIAWTNTIANMPAWGATDARLGNNPMVFALPYQNEAIVLDMAMSQYSFGAMELSKMSGEQLAVPGGYNEEGLLTADAGAILKSKRPLPIGYWKGAGLSLLLDLLATVLSGGLSTQQISQEGIEFCSQVFIAIDLAKLGNASLISGVIENIIADYHQCVPESEKAAITYPGERVLETRRKNQQNGIPVIRQVWDEISSL